MIPPWFLLLLQKETAENREANMLALVGGSLGAKRDDNNKIIIEVDLGKFSSKKRLFPCIVLLNPTSCEK